MTVICEGVAGVKVWIPPKKNSGDYCWIHREVKRIKGSALEYSCIQCDGLAETWAWQHGEDPLDINSYEPMCYACHNLYDRKEDTIKKMTAHAIGNKYRLGDISNRGENNGQAKITAKDVLEMRAMYEQGIWTYKEIAEIYGLNSAYVGTIIKRKRWRHV